MRKKTALFILALLLTAAANLRPCCELSVDGNRLSGLYSISCADAGERAAAAAAERLDDMPPEKRYAGAPRAFAWLSRRSLLIYLFHQPVLLALTALLLRAAQGA